MDEKIHHDLKILGSLVAIIERVGNSVLQSVFGPLNRYRSERLATLFLDVLVLAKISRKFVENFPYVQLEKEWENLSDIHYNYNIYIYRLYTLCLSSYQLLNFLC